MFRLAGSFLFAWGAGLGGSGPLVVTEGPFWASSHHMVQHRMTGFCAKPHVVAPGRVWAADRTLMTFAFFEEE